jgi:hypothetical protein
MERDIYIMIGRGRGEGGREIETNISTHIYYNNKYVICHYKALQTSNAVTVKLIIIISSHVHVYIMNSANDTHISLHSANI